MMRNAQLSFMGRTYTSRMMGGTGKYPNFQVMKDCHTACGAEIVTVAVRRLDLTAKGEEALLHWIDPKLSILPNTAACYTAEDAVRTARLAEELGFGKWVKLEV